MTVQNAPLAPLCEEERVAAESPPAASANDPPCHAPTRPPVGLPRLPRGARARRTAARKGKETLRLGTPGPRGKRFAGPAAGATTTAPNALALPRIGGRGGGGGGAHLTSASSPLLDAPPASAAAPSNKGGGHGGYPYPASPNHKASDMCFFCMPAQWVMPYLQWAAGEKMCHLP